MVFKRLVSTPRRPIRTRPRFIVFRDRYISSEGNRDPRDPSARLKLI
jgi:hypothetical protein